MGGRVRKSDCWLRDVTHYPYNPSTYHVLFRFSPTWHPHTPCPVKSHWKGEPSHEPLDLLKGISPTHSGWERKKTLCLLWSHLCGELWWWWCTHSVTKMPLETQDPTGLILANYHPPFPALHQVTWGCGTRADTGLLRPDTSKSSWVCGQVCQRLVRPWLSEGSGVLRDLECSSLLLCPVSPSASVPPSSFFPFFPGGTLLVWTPTQFLQV